MFVPFGFGWLGLLNVELFSWILNKVQLWFDAIDNT